MITQKIYVNNLYNIKNNMLFFLVYSFSLPIYILLFYIVLSSQYLLVLERRLIFSMFKITIQVKENKKADTCNVEKQNIMKKQQVKWL